MNKTNYIILTLILCFSIVFVTFPLKSFSSQINGGGTAGSSGGTCVCKTCTGVNGCNHENFYGNECPCNHECATPDDCNGTTTPPSGGNGNGNGNGTPPPPSNGGGCEEEEPPSNGGTPPSLVWYTYKRCTEGRCVNHSTTVGPSADQCSTHADCGGGTSSNGTPSNGWTPPPSNGTPSNGWTPPPPPLPKYSCNQSTWTCYQNSSGPYSSLSSCQSACVEPPCMINYFEFLQKRAWVGYPITGRWSASAWCVDCDVTCTPYPECVWQQDNIGIGFDEHEFTLEQSGDYTYTLTCYKQGGRDQKQVTVSLEALNLPWWREIIPVLQGFLGGVWR